MDAFATTLQELVRHDRGELKDVCEYAMWISQPIWERKEVRRMLGDDYVFDIVIDDDFLVQFQLFLAQIHEPQYRGRLVKGLLAFLSLGHANMRREFQDTCTRPLKDPEFHTFLKHATRDLTDHANK